MRRPPATSTFAYSFGPGPLTPAVKLLIISNVVVFIASRFVDVLRLRLGFMPQDVLTHGYIWQPFTYMFVHDGIFHILFNMLALWMFGVELERMWGSRYFTKFYLVSGIGAAVINALVVRTVRSASTGLLHPDGRRLGRGLRRPARVRYALSASPDLHVFRLSNTGEVLRHDHRGDLAAVVHRRPGGGIAHTTHLGGLVAAYLYLKGGKRTHLMSEIKYRYLKWRINRMRRRFDVISGGRANDVDRRVH